MPAEAVCCQRWLARRACETPHPSRERLEWALKHSADQILHGLGIQRFECRRAVRQRERRSQKAKTTGRDFVPVANLSFRPPARPPTLGQEYCGGRALVRPESLRRHTEVSD